MSESPEVRRINWLRRLARELEKPELILPGEILPGRAAYPEWVKNIERELSVYLIPSANLKAESREITARRMGALVGHACGMAVWIKDAILKEVQNAATIASEPIAEGEPLGGRFTQEFAIWYKRVCRLAKLSLCSCVDQSYQDMTDFLEGYSDAFARKPRTLNVGELGNPTFEIYLYMIRNWRLIECKKSVREFHAMLVNHFSASRVGDLKRIEKLCQRVGKSFGKAGRPKRS